LSVARADTDGDGDDADYYKLMGSFDGENCTRAMQGLRRVTL
jgi:hypothetical protein